MNRNTGDLFELRQDDLTSAELQRMAANINAVDVSDQREGC